MAQGAVQTVHDPATTDGVVTRGVKICVSPTMHEVQSDPVAPQSRHGEVHATQVAGLAYLI